MQVEKALKEDCDADNAAGQNRPHEQPALLDVINHGGNLLSPFYRRRPAALGLTCARAWCALLAMPLAQAKRFRKPIFQLRRIPSNRSVSRRDILVENLVHYSVILRQMGLLLQPAGRALFI